MIIRPYHPGAHKGCPYNPSAHKGRPYKSLYLK